jgi:hypothetical protein
MIMRFGLAIALCAPVGVCIALPLPAQLHAPALPLARELHIDAAQHDLEPIRELTVGPKGIITITQRGDGRVILFGSDGKRIARVGRTGEGPGEFRYLHRIGWQGDLLWAHDQTLNRITMISQTGNVVRTVAIPTSLGANPATRRQPLGQWLIPTAFPDANTLILVGQQGPSGQRPSWQRSLGDGSMDVAVDSMGNFQQVVRMVRSPTNCRQRVGEMIVTVPQCPRTWNSRSANGRLLAVAATKRVAAAQFETTVTVLTATGDTVYTRKLAFTGERMNAAQRDSIIEHEKREASVPAYARAIAGVTLPEAFDPFRQMLMGDDGTVWLRERNRGGQAVWVQLDRTGTPAARVVLPIGARLMVPSRGQLWGLQEDQDGVESIVRWRVVR